MRTNTTTQNNDGIAAIASNFGAEAVEGGEEHPVDLPDFPLLMHVENPENA